MPLICGFVITLITRKLNTFSFFLFWHFDVALNCISLFAINQRIHSTFLCMTIISMRVENTKIKFLIKFISWCIQNSEHSRFLSRHIIYLDRALFHKIAKLHKFRKVILWCKCLIFSRALIPDPPTLLHFPDRTLHSLSLHLAVLARMHFQNSRFRV